MDRDLNQSSQIFTESAPPVYAGFWERFAAMLLDGLILMVPMYLLGRATGYDMFDMDTRRSFSMWSLIIGPSLEYGLINAAIGWLYYAFQESGPAQATLGKRALSIKVVGSEGQRISFLNATGRFFGKYISQIIIFIGYFMMVWDSRSQTLHDKMANTFVVKG
jgi:uncharacterized RDD family membrane protein YckC